MFVEFNKKNNISLHMIFDRLDTWWTKVFQFVWKNKNNIWYKNAFIKQFVFCSWSLCRKTMCMNLEIKFLSYTRLYFHSLFNKAVHFDVFFDHAKWTIIRIRCDKIRKTLLVIARRQCIIWEGENDMKIMDFHPKHCFEIRGFWGV